MANNEHTPALFREADLDRYILTAEAEIALSAAWQVLQAFEMAKSGRLEFYDDDRRDNTLDYLRSGGEERPYSGIFAVEMRKSWDHDDEVDLMVSNRNGYGNEDYRAILRSTVSTVGIEEKSS